MAQPIALLRQHSADLHATSRDVRCRSADGRELIWTVNPSHSITGGLPPISAMNGSEMYGEYFDIPQPDELIFISSCSEGDVFRSGCRIQTGAGRIFHFSLGDQEYSIHRHPIGGCLVTNGVRWSFRERGVQPEPYRLQKMEYGWIDGFVANPPVPHDSLGLTSPRALKLGRPSLSPEAQASPRDVLAFCAREGRDPKAAETGN